MKILPQDPKSSSPLFISSETNGPIELFQTTMVMDMQAQKYGNQRLKDFFNEEIPSLICFFP